ncbi:MAG: AMP-binding protein [Phycisphaerales bacterium]|nr:AMP-binding protein [Phycisphaerales bacterium]
MLLTHLFQHAAQNPQTLAMIDDSGSYTYQQLAGMSAGLGMYLSLQTQKPNVGLFLPSGAGFAASFYGAQLAGKTPVLINFLLSDREIAHIIADSGIDTVVSIPPLTGRLAAASVNVIDLKQLPKTPPTAITPHLPSPKPDDTAALLYTSGTSGLPKGVMLTYQNLDSCVSACIQAAQLKEQHKFLGIVPMFHSLGLTATLLAPIQLGASSVYLARFSPVAALEAIRKYQIGLVFGVPSMFGAMANLKNITPEDFASIYAIISGGEPLSGAVREEFAQRTGQSLHEGYGLTETCGPIAFNTPHAHKQGSVGQLLPGCSARFVDDDGHDVPAGHSGEIWLKGPLVFKGYHNLPELTQQALTADGYFKTGDLGRTDEQGFLYITGRKKDLIAVAGEKVAPREIEEVLMKHPAVAEAAVVGKKDASRGEVVVAFVIAHDQQAIDPQILRDFCRQHGLPNWKLPREIFINSELPRSPTGKVLKRELSARANGEQ